MVRINLDNFEKILLISISSTVGLFFSILIFVVFHDYLFIPFHSIMVSLTGTAIGAWVVPLFELFITNSLMILGVIDFIWLGAFVTMIFSVFRKFYYMKRESYFDLFGFLCFGVLFFLFVSSIFEAITRYLYTIFFEGILANITPSLLFFNFYINNYTLINLFIICVCLILNHVDLDFVNYFSRKDKENITVEGNNARQEL